MFVVRPVSSLKDIVTTGVTAFVICSKFLFPVLSISQYYQPTHFSGTQVVGGLNVTVTGTGTGSSYLISLMSFNSVCKGNTCSRYCCIFKAIPATLIADLKLGVLLLISFIFCKLRWR